MAEMHKVVSSNIDAIGFDEAGLHVRFKNGKTYIHDAPVGVFHSLQAAKSPGSYYSCSVKGFFPHRKVTDAPSDNCGSGEQEHA